MRSPTLPTLSIIIPVLNGAGTLQRCLAAVTAIGRPRAEVIVVDDGSTDASASIARSFPVRVIQVEDGPRGAAFARNRGAEAAAGDILLFIDADVLIAPDTLARVVAAFADRPQIAAIFGSYDTSPAAAQLVSQYKNLSHHFVHQRAHPEGRTFWSGCGAVRRTVFFALGKFDETMRSFEDVELGYRLHAAGHRIWLDKRLQVKHLKRWTLRSMIKSDVFDRGIPWTLLVWQARALPNDLNLRLSQRVSALLIYAALGLLALSLALHTLVLLPAVSLALLLTGLLNHDFYAFFARQRGIAFAIAVIPLHMLTYIYSVLAFALGTLIFFGSYIGNNWPRVRSTRIQP